MSLLDLSISLSMFSIDFSPQPFLERSALLLTLSSCRYSEVVKSTLFDDFDLNAVILEPLLTLSLMSLFAVLYCWDASSSARLSRYRSMTLRMIPSYRKVSCMVTLCIQRDSMCLCIQYIPSTDLILICIDREKVWGKESVLNYARYTCTWIRGYSDIHARGIHACICIYICI